MEPKQLTRRLIVLGGLFALFLAFFIVTMFREQIVNGDDYLSKSIRTNARVESVEASRGVITDRNGKVMVSNRAIHTLEFDASLVSGDALNDALLRLLALLSERGIDYQDELPLEREAPYAYGGSASEYSRLAKYLVSLKWIEEGAVNENGTPSTLSALALFSSLRTQYGVDETLSPALARALVGLRYTLAALKLDGYTSCTVVSDIDVELISLLKDGDYAGVRIGSSSVRVYETEAAAHVLGHIGKITSDTWPAYKEKDYNMNDLVGIDGAELAFEDYLRGADGKRVITMNDSGKVTSELYSVEPQPGSTVALTIDLDLQEAAEEILKNTITAMDAVDGVERSGAIAAVGVGSGDVLALASYPTFSLATFNQDFNELSSDPLRPMWNRATLGTYAPGSTIKPLTAVAALESGVTSAAERIFDAGRWFYPGYSASYTWCWNHSGHGYVNVTSAITNSCNTYFAEMGYRLGMERLRGYFSAFGLGEHTGIEIGDAAGTLPSQEEGTDLAPWAAYGQANQLYTPLQLANYIATLAGGGARYEAHLLKEVRRYDSAALLDVYNKPAVDSVAIGERNLDAVLSGMHNLVTSGSLSGYFKNCIVDAAAKTGTAQTSNIENTDGVFVCFAPYDDPQIAIAIVVEKGGTGTALASTAVQVLNAYFSSADAEAPAVGENVLLR